MFHSYLTEQLIFLSVTSHCNKTSSKLKPGQLAAKKLNHCKDFVQAFYTDNAETKVPATSDSGIFTFRYELYHTFPPLTKSDGIELCISQYCNFINLLLL